MSAELVDVRGGRARALGRLRRGQRLVAASNDDGTSAGRIVRIDPETHEVQAEIPVEVIPAWPDAVWILDYEGTLTRVGLG